MEVTSPALSDWVSKGNYLSDVKICIVGLIALSVSSCTGDKPIHEFSLQTDLPSHIPFCFVANPETSAYKYLAIENMSTGNLYSAQRGGDGQVCFIPSEEIQKTTKLIIKEGIRNPAHDCQINQEEDNIVARIDGKEILRYALQTVLPPDSLPSYYKRSGFIHPLRSLSGALLTSDFPEGHAHQHGIFNAWVNTTYRGSPFDFWNQQKEQGTVRHKNVLNIQNGPVFCSFTTSLEHLAFLENDTAIVLDEIWHIKIFPMDSSYIMDFTSRQACHSDDTLFINQYHYGGFAFRGNENWNFEAALDSVAFFITNEGKTHVDGNHTHPVWSDMYGWIEGRMAGLAIIDHPSNFRYPQAVRIPPNMPYFVYAPSVDGPFSIDPGSDYHASYRLFIHDGKPPVEWIEKARVSFAGMKMESLIIN